MRGRAARSGALAAATSGFILLLLYLTLTPPVRGPGAAPSERGELEDACAAALRQRLADARLPFPTRTNDLPGGRSRVEGVVDAPAGPEAIRWNYTCLVRRDVAGALRIDSLGLWQSH